MTLDNKIDHLHIICYRWGTKYGAEYVNILRAMIARNLSVPHTFHCITDDPAGLHEAIVAHPLPDTGVTGIWRKLMTFSHDFLGLEGEWVVSFDLDLVIVGNLDFLAEQPDKTFVIGRNWSRNLKSGKGARASGSVYRLKVGSHAFVWENLIADFDGAVDRYHGKNRDIGEQNWLNAHIDEFNYFPDGKIVSFKRHCQAKGHRLLGFNTAWFGTAQPPEPAAIVSFHGDPLAPDVRDHRYGVWRQAPFVNANWYVEHRLRPAAQTQFGVVIPSYNRPQDLKGALDSLQAQSYGNWRAVIVNDASTVDYSEIENAYRDDPRFIFVTRYRNGGINAARNGGMDLLLSLGVDYLCFLDDDDEFVADFFATALTVLQQHPGYGWYMSNNAGERKRSQRDIEHVGEIDWIDDYIYGKMRGDKAHLFAAAALRDIRLDERFRASNRWRFFIDLNRKTRILGYPAASIRKRYQEGGITKGHQGQYKGPKTALEIRSRFEKHWYVIRLRPTQWGAYKYLLLELLKSPKRLLQLWRYRRSQPSL